MAISIIRLIFIGALLFTIIVFGFVIVNERRKAIRISEINDDYTRIDEAKRKRRKRLAAADETDSDISKKRIVPKRIDDIIEEDQRHLYALTYMDDAMGKTSPYLAEMYNDSDGYIYDAY